MNKLATIDVNPYEWTLVLWTHQPSMMRTVRRLVPEAELKVKKIAGRCCTVFDHKEFHLGIFDGSIRTLGHELFHLVIELAGYIGMSICEETSEPCAYLFDWLLGQCLDAFAAAKRQLE